LDNDAHPKSGKEHTELKRLLGTLGALSTRLAALESRLDEMEREQRLIIMGGLQPEIKDPWLAQSPNNDLLKLVESLEVDKFKPDDPRENESFIDHVSRNLDENRKNQSNIYLLLLRILLRQEIQNSRSKLLFIAQSKKDLDMSLFDDLSELEVLSSNPHIHPEELSLRWKVFEERVARELERLHMIEVEQERGIHE
jgi:hypothetical protein